MEKRVKMVNTVTVVGGTILLSGIILFLTGMFVSTYSILVPIGIGTIVSAVFIFLMGIFFVVSEEVIARGKGDDTKIPQI